MIYDKFEKLNDGKHDRAIKALIGISRPKFDKLAVAFAAAYPAIQQERCEQGVIKQVQSGRPKGHLDSSGKRLFFLLYYLKTYPTFDVPGFHFGFSSGHAHNHVENLMPVLLRGLSDLGVLPERSPGTPAEFLQLVEKYGDILVDGMECPCVRPQDEELQKARYSGKKNATRSRHSSLRQRAGKSFSSFASSPEASMTTRS
jgi:hypothetical protein